MKHLLLVALLFGGVGSPPAERTVFREAPVVVIQQVPVPEAITVAFKDIPALSSTFKQAEVVQRAVIPGNGYEPGYCTWYSKERRPDLPNQLGDANSWISSAIAQGIPTGHKPIVGAIAATTAGAFGHVAYIEQVDGSRVLVSEMNFQGRGVINQRWTDSSEWTGFLY